MITAKTKDNNASYTALFEEAYKFLKDNISKLTNEDRKAQVTQWLNETEEKAAASNTTPRFTSIQEYFSHLKDLLDVGGKKFLMLPLDEPVFEIDADKREITVPAVFKKNGISVKGDEIAESLIFRINRFFDYADLNEMKVQVQWENANKEQGISDIYVVDAERNVEYLYLMWPLTERITKYPGTIKFSVRFYNAWENGKMAYSFATKIAAATINDGHNFNMTDGSLGDIDNASSQFGAAITNSKNTAEEDANAPYFLLNLDSKYIIPDDPEHTGVNENYDEKVNGVLEAYIDEDNPSQILRVQATTADQGIIGYEWYYVDTVVKDGLFDNFGGKLYFLDSEIEYLPTNDTKAVENKKYYVKNGENYSEMDYAMAGPGVELYEKFSIVRVAKDHMGHSEPGASSAALDHVVGKYYAKAYNYVGSNSNSESSKTVVFPGPSVPKFTETGALPTNAYLDNNGRLTIKVAAVEDEICTKITYRWKYSQNGFEAWVDIDDASFAAQRRKLTVSENGDTLTVDGLTGYFKVEAIATRNYERSVKESANACKITPITPAPVVLAPTKDTAVSSRYSNATLVVKVKLFNSEFESEGMSYQWWKAGDGKDIKDAPIEGASGSLKATDEGIITYVTDRYDDGSYWCVISNRIGDVVRETKSPVFSVGNYVVTEPDTEEEVEEVAPTGTVSIPATVKANETVDFSVTTVANDKAGIMVKGTIDSDVSKLHLQYQDSDGEYKDLVEDFGPKGGFPLSDTTSNFKATPEEEGSYNFNILIKTVNGGDTIITIPVSFTVEAAE